MNKDTPQSNTDWREQLFEVGAYINANSDDADELVTFISQLLEAEKKRWREELVNYAEGMILPVEDNAPRNSVGVQKKRYYNKALQRFIKEAVLQKLS